MSINLKSFTPNISVYKYALELRAAPSAAEVLSTLGAAVKAPGVGKPNLNEAVGYGPEPDTPDDRDVYLGKLPDPVK